MDIKASINIKKERDGFAETTLSVEGSTAELRIGLADFGPLPVGSSEAVDLLTVASVVYAADQLVSRETSRDGWTRSLAVTVPVRNTSKWVAVTRKLENCVSFLTGDVWKFSFEQLAGNPVKARRGALLSPKARAVCLFSGGLDSLVGAMDWLAANHKDQLILIGHHDKQGRAQADQKRLVSAIAANRPALAKRVHPRHVAVWQSAKAQDINYRSRSFLFLSLGYYAASCISNDIAVLIPENGTIAVNVPLTPSRRGSCSTRTAHPFFIEQYKAIVRDLGLKQPLVNPFINRTKGEVVAQCRDPDLLKAVYTKSVSCAKSTRRMHWKRTSADHCGHCMPCIYRRAAVHAAGLPAEVYGLDVCRGEVDLDGTARHADDFRALFSFLKRDLTHHQIADVLRAGSSFGSSDVEGHAKVVERAMNEIRAWLKAEGENELCRRAGIE